VVVGTAAAVWAGGSGARAGVHVVSPGETLSEIAHRYETTVEALAEANHLGDPDLIVAGQRLRVPRRAAVVSVHVVRRGETLSQIAARYGTTVGALARANRIHDVDLIVTGTELRVRPGGAAQPSPVNTSVGESLEAEADARGVNTELVKAVAHKESGWQQEVTSEAGAVGVMQVMPGTADYVNKRLGGGRLDLNQTTDNVRLGVIYLDHLLETMPSERKALAAYLSGPAAVGRRLRGYQRRYVRDVEKLKRKY
jgi:LysM repeat protein